MAAKQELTPAQKAKRLVGMVVSNKMQKTIVVQVDRQVRHSLYKKYVKRSQKFKAHDETNQAKIGDMVEIVQTRPLSRSKCWALTKVVRAAKAEGLVTA